MQRAALVLRHMEGLSVPELAQVLGRSVEAAESLLSRGRVGFKRAYLEESFVNDPIAALLADFDDAVDPRPAFAAALRERLVDELGRPRRRLLRSRRARGC